jgi:uncharacterized protein YlxW (UPF0749 family)
MSHLKEEKVQPSDPNTNVDQNDLDVVDQKAALVHEMKRHQQELKNIQAKIEEYSQKPDDFESWSETKQEQYLNNWRVQRWRQKLEREEKTHTLRMRMLASGCTLAPVPDDFE